VGSGVGVGDGLKGSDVRDGFNFGRVEKWDKPQQGVLAFGLWSWQVSQSQPMYRTATKPLLTVILA
jgi:hypothetical protein